MLSETFTPTLLKQLQLMKMKSRRTFLGTKQGGHVSIKKGHGIEFSDYREYQLGDNPRHIDWGVYARSDRLYVKRYQEDRDLPVFIFLDSSESMKVPETKWQFSRDVVIALAYVALLQQDKVKLCIPSAIEGKTYAGAKAIHVLGSDFVGISKGREVNLSLSLQKAIASVRFPGIGIFISDFLMPFEEIEKNINLLRAKNLDITAIQVLSPEDKLPLEEIGKAIVVDSENSSEYQLTMTEAAREEYYLLLREHEEKIRKFFFSTGISFSQVTSNELFSDFLVNNLAQTGLLQ